MMSPILRVELILISLAFILLVMRAVGKRRLMMRYSIAWLAVAGVNLLIAIFPGVAIRLSQLAGFEKPSNMVYLIGIFVLLMICFYYAVVLSRLALQVKALTQELAIREHLDEHSRKLPEQE